MSVVSCRIIFSSSAFHESYLARTLMPVLTLGITGGGGRGFLDKRSNKIAAKIIVNNNKTINIIQLLNKCYEEC